VSRKRIALVGTPNAGKTALFNALTRSHQRTANYSGVTVESAEADLRLPSGEVSVLVDLPGAYSLRPYTEDEGVLARALAGQEYDGMILVADATQPERSIRFILEVLDTTSIQCVIALNMMDLAESRGFQFDLSRFETETGVPIVSCSAIRKTGLKALTHLLEKAVNGPRREKHVFFSPPDANETREQSSRRILDFYKRADEIKKGVLLRAGDPDARSRQIDRIVLHPVWGLIILVAMLGLTFQLMFNLAQWPMDLIEGVISGIQSTVNESALPELVRSFISDGVLAGVGGTLVFLPQILILFAMILLLEDVGFMARAVFILDHLMGKVGLHGRAFLPLLSSYACAVPGIMATRTMEERRDRIITTWIIPLTTCSARLPVYTLLISAFVPNSEVFGGMRLQGLVMLGLYGVGLVTALTVGAILKKLLFKKGRPPLLIELPSYKRPSFRSLLKGLLYRARLFLVRVGTVILVLSVLIWGLLSFPRADNGSALPIESTYAGRIGKTLEPVLSPLGFDWRIGMALVPTFAAREVMVSTLATVYAVEGRNGPGESADLGEVLRKEWGVATGVSLLVWFIFAPMCLSTLATVRRELQGTKHAVFMTIYLFALAYGASWITFSLLSRWVG
jgi:ferrous iron transport protein B